MEAIESYGKTIDEAVENGLKEMGLTKEQVDVEVLEEPVSKGILFKKVTQAKVKLTKKASDAQRAVNFLDGLFDLLNMHAATEIVRDDDKICINLTAANSSYFIGYRGEVLDSLQCLAGAVANIGREDYRRVVVDCEQYREKRESTLISLAGKIADKAVRTGRKVNLEPMNPYERRIIHTALADSSEVKTESEGKEPNRYIVVVPNDLRDDRPILADRNRGRDGGNGGFRKLDRGGSYRGSNGYARGGKPYSGGGASRDGYRGNGNYSGYGSSDRASNDRSDAYGAKRGYKDNRGSSDGYKKDNYGSRDNYRGGGRSYNRDEKRGETTVYGKPKDKNNVTSFGTFIGNSHKNED